MTSQLDFAGFFERCVDLAKHYPYAEVPSCRAYADCDNEHDNALWFVEFTDDDHRAGVMYMLSAALKYRDAHRYGLVMNFEDGRFMVAAASRTGETACRFYQAPRPGVAGFQPIEMRAGFEWATRLFEMSKGFDDERMQLAECGLMMAIESGTPKITNGAIGKRAPGKKTLFH